MRFSHGVVNCHPIHRTSVMNPAKTLSAQPPLDGVRQATRPRSFVVAAAA
jgi:hypothetical protein